MELLKKVGKYEIWFDGTYFRVIYDAGAYYANPRCVSNQMHFVQKNENIQLETLNFSSMGAAESWIEKFGE